MLPGPVPCRDRRVALSPNVHLRSLALPALFFAGTLPGQNTVQVALNYNFNGIAHAGETGSPDAPNGFRSISDRALDFTGGVPSAPVFQRFAVVATAGALDLVHLGNRNTVDGGNWAFDPLPNGNDIGVQPNWLSNPNQSGPQITVLPAPVALGIASSASVLFHVSNGGGSCNVTFTYQSGAGVRRAGPMIRPRLRTCPTRAIRC
jgi:hypothetical protein